MSTDLLTIERIDDALKVRQIPVHANPAVEILAREIAKRPGNEGSSFGNIDIADRREFAEFCFDNMTKFEAQGWFGDALLDRQLELLALARESSAANTWKPASDSRYAGRERRLNKLYRLVNDAFLQSTESLYNRAVFDGRK